MLVKAFIRELPKIGENEFVIRIPYFEDTTGTEILMNALLCYQPGEYNGYKIGDCVIVGFDGVTLNTPIILGKLYTGVEEDDLATHIVNSLEIKNKVNLPSNTTIDGFGVIDFIKLYNK